MDIHVEVEQYYSSEIDRGRPYLTLETVINAELVEKGQFVRRTNSDAITRR